MDLLGTQERPLRVAIIGSGPSGFYAAAALFQTEGVTAEVDMFDRLPTPYGLVRGGVAPDHQKIKSVIRKYRDVAARPGFRFFGHVHVGRDVDVRALSEHYDAVVFATGNETDRRMGVPGEELAGVFSATEFVGWYNGHPDFQGRDFGLERARRVAVVGNGNVAMDVTRILARSPNDLSATDITGEAHAALVDSAVREILLLGRRGPAQAAFSPAEIKEIGSLDAADLVVAADEIALGEVTERWLEATADRDALKNVAYLREVAARGEGARARKVRCRFLVSPVELLGEGGRLTAMRLMRNELTPDHDGTPRPRPAGEPWVEPVDLLFKAIGYRGVPIAGVPFDDRRGIFPNATGRMAEPGWYVVGWAKRGPSGLIGTNKADSEATIEALLADLRGRPAADRPGDVEALLREKGVDAASFQDWERLDRHEVDAGAAVGKLREKVTAVEEMMKVIRLGR